MGTKSEKNPVIKAFPKAFQKAYELQIKKGADYNNNIKLEDYFPFGLKSYVQEINKKNLRLVSLARSEQVPNNESIEDTLLDMINYCDFALRALQDV